MRPYLEEKEDVLAQAGSSMEGLSEEEVGLLQATLETILDNGEQLAEEVAR